MGDLKVRMTIRSDHTRDTAKINSIMYKISFNTSKD